MGSSAGRIGIVIK